MPKIFNQKGAFKQILILCFLFSFVRLNHIVNSIDEKPNLTKTENYTVDLTNNSTKKYTTRKTSSLTELNLKKLKIKDFQNQNQM